MPTSQTEKIPSKEGGSAVKPYFLRISAVCSLLLLLIFPSTPVSGLESFITENIRVAVIKGADTLRIEGDGFLVADDRGDPQDIAAPLQLRCDNGMVAVAGKSFRRLVISSPTPLTVNGKPYRGVIDVSASGKSLQVVNELPLEDYLIGVINCEISSQWPMEAIKAQAIVARTYALYQKAARAENPYHLESSVLDQVYDGCSLEDGRAARAVRETEGEVVFYDGKPIQAFFHSSCGGRTEASENVWGVALPYLRGVRCDYCITTPSVRWEQSLPFRKLEALLKAGGVQATGLKEVRCGSRNSSGRVTDVALVTARGSVEIPAVKFRKIIGYSTIKSTNFTVRNSGDNALFAGSGHGHGVGLCQWGAKERATDGFSAREIISYYYPGTSVRKLY